jgi:hypothetical protein
MKHAKILHWDDERNLGNGIIVTTKPGWAFRPHDDERVAEHVKGFDLVKEARSEMKWVKRCQCSRCKAGD